MLTEFEVRRRMEAIRQSRTSPFRKARMLLRLGRVLKSQVRSLSRAKAQTALTADINTSAGLARMASKSAMLHEDVREAAIGVLHPGPSAGFSKN